MSIPYCCSCAWVQRLSPTAGSGSVLTGNHRTHSTGRHTARHRSSAVRTAFRWILIVTLGTSRPPTRRQGVEWTSRSNSVVLDDTFDVSASYVTGRGQKSRFLHGILVLVLLCYCRCCWSVLLFCYSDWVTYSVMRVHTLPCGLPSFGLPAAVVYQ